MKIQLGGGVRHQPQYEDLIRMRREHLARIRYAAHRIRYPVYCVFKIKRAPVITADISMLEAKQQLP
ncbi:hypothetical protein D3C73_1640660 [compost metagenome]